MYVCTYVRAGVNVQKPAIYNISKFLKLYKQLDENHHSTVTDFAKLRGQSTSQPRSTAI